LLKNVLLGDFSIVKTSECPYTDLDSIGQSLKVSLDADKVREADASVT
jgi:hypothetical protein